MNKLKRSREITPDPKYEATPVDGKLFDVWILDSMSEQLIRVDRMLTYTEALEWQSKWMEADRKCIPVIVRQGYRIPSTIYRHEA